MKIDFELIRTIARDLNIPKNTNEKQESWMCRVIYSALGRTALVSLWDHEEFNEPISITHFKRRIEKNLYAYKSLYPEIATSFTVEIDDLVNEIYEIYSSMGYLYHSPNRIAPAAFSSCKCNDIALTRGVSPGDKLFMSGLGSYDIVRDNKDMLTPNLMFVLPKQTLIESWELLIKAISWKEDTITQRKEFLRITPPFNRGYWKEGPDLNGETSLFRVGSPGGYIYYLYRFEGDKCFISQISEWLTTGYEYRKISNWLLASRKQLPPIDFCIKNDLVTLKLNYLLPPKEMDFLKLYTWPINFYKLPSDFNRICTKNVFYALKDTLEHIGYQFKEEK